MFAKEALPMIRLDIIRPANDTVLPSYSATLSLISMECAVTSYLVMVNGSLPFA